MGKFWLGLRATQALCFVSRVDLLQISDTSLAAMLPTGAAIVGFTASTDTNFGGTTNISNWQFFTTPASSLQSSAEPAATWQNGIVATNTQPAGYRFYVQERVLQPSEWFSS